MFCAGNARGVQLRESSTGPMIKLVAIMSSSQVGLSRDRRVEDVARLRSGQSHPNWRFPEHDGEASACFDAGHHQLLGVGMIASCG